MPIDFEGEKCLYMSIATYNTISSTVALNFLQNSLKILQPYLRDPDLRCWVIWTPVGSKSRARYLKQFLRGLKVEEIAKDFPLAGLALIVWKEGLRSIGRDPHIGGIEILFSEALVPELGITIASQLEFAANVETLLKGQVPWVVQEQVVELALSTFTAVDGVVGYITVDYVGTGGFTDSPYERAVGLAYVWAAREFRSKVRGYYWGNLLSSGHVELLGGEAILQKAPVYLVKKLENGYYLQLTEDINNIDRDKLAQLKEFLKPLLPEGYPQSPEYYENLPNFLL